jgi:hypothetical protein
VPIDVIIDGDRIFFWVETNFLAVKPGLASGRFTVEAGDIVRVTVWAHYVVEAGLMKTIVTNQLKGELIGKTMTMEEAIKDSQSRAKKPEFFSIKACKNCLDYACIQLSQPWSRLW